MSHFTRLKTCIKDLDIVEEVLKELQYQYLRTLENERLTIQDYSRKVHNVELKVTGRVQGKVSERYGIGFEKDADENYSIVADWWGVERKLGIKEKSFCQEMMQMYAYQKVKQTIKEHGYLVASDEITEKGERKIRIEMY